MQQLDIEKIVGQQADYTARTIRLTVQGQDGKQRQVTASFQTAQELRMILDGLMMEPEMKGLVLPYGTPEQRKVRYRGISGGPDDNTA